VFGILNCIGHLGDRHRVTTLGIRWRDFSHDANATRCNSIVTRNANVTRCNAIVMPCNGNATHDNTIVMPHIAIADIGAIV
jgi:hypothetical protein